MNRSLFAIWCHELKSQIQPYIPMLYQQLKQKEPWHYLLVRPIPAVLRVIGWQQKINAWIFYGLSGLGLLLLYYLLFGRGLGSRLFPLYMLYSLYLASICYFFRRYELLISPAGMRYRLFLFGICYLERHYDLMVDVVHWQHYSVFKKEKVVSPWVVIYNQSQDSAFFQHFFHQAQDQIFFHIGASLVLYGGKQSKQLCRVIQDQIYLSIQERMKNPIPFPDKVIDKHLYWIFAWIGLFPKSLGLKKYKRLGYIELSWWECKPSRDLLLLCFIYFLFLLYVVVLPILSSLFLILGITVIFSHRYAITVSVQSIEVTRKILGIPYFHRKYSRALKQVLCFDEFQSPMANALLLSEPRGMSKLHRIENVDFNDILQLAQPWNCGEIYRLLLEARTELGHFDEWLKGQNEAIKS